MASAFKISSAARNAACDAIVDLLDAGTPPGLLTIRTGSPPTNVSDADSGSLIATLTFSTTAFGAAGASVTGMATAATITSDTSADSSNIAGHFRAKNAAGTTIFQGTAGESADTPDMVFDESTIVAGGTVACTSMTVTVPVS